jgi:ribA/ribD-fused uncharacterized protein
MKYIKSDVISFNSSKDEFGVFGNMAGGFPITIEQYRIHGSEILYQCLKYVDYPDLQKQLIKEKNPLKAKWKQKKWSYFLSPTWDEDKLLIMYFCILIKFYQNWGKLSRYLNKTNNKDIVEISKKDNYWGTILQPDGETLIGNNYLGLCWMKLRYELKINNIQTIMNEFISDNEDKIKKLKLCEINLIDYFVA